MFDCELKADHANFCRNFDCKDKRKFDGEAEALPRVDDFVFLLLRNDRQRVIESEGSFCYRLSKGFVSKIYTIYITMPNPIMFRRKLQTTNQKLTAKSASDKPAKLKST